MLLLGGTLEANRIAAALAAAGVPALYSYAGRTRSPAGQPLPIRIGGFGGVPGLIAWLRERDVDCVVDATHPFAEQISRHASIACERTGAALIAFDRPPWAPVPGDRWRHLPSLAAAAAALPTRRSTVFLAIGRQSLGAFAARREHRYLIRTVDRLDGSPADVPSDPAGAPPNDSPDRSSLPLDDVIHVVERGPFDVEGDRALLETHAVDLVVARNAGGGGAYAKLEAARALGLEVLLVERPASPARAPLDDVDAVVRAVRAHLAHRGV